MENVIDYATLFAPLMDELYKQEAKTSILEGDETTVKKGAHGEIKVAKIDMDALGDYDRKSGYTKGGTKFAWETVKYDKERSQELTIDRLDNDEALEMPASKLLSEFIRTKVIPETDAARIAKICGTAGITVKEEKLADGAAVVKALRAASDKMDNDEVPEESRILFIVGSYLSLIEDMDTTKSKKILDKFSTIIKMPQSRMYTQITLADGKTEYGYKKTPTTGKNVNFVVIEKSAAVSAMEQWIKYFSPDENQNGDSHKWDYRNNNLYAHVYENKLAGVYCSHDSE